MFLWCVYTMCCNTSDSTHVVQDMLDAATRLRAQALLPGSSESARLAACQAADAAIAAAHADLVHCYATLRGGTNADAVVGC